MKYNRVAQFLFFVVAVFAALTAHDVAVGLGPSTPYYITDGANRVLQVVQSGAIVNSWRTIESLYPLAVGSTVKTYNEGAEGFGLPHYTDPGIEYTLAGVPTGATYSWQPGPVGQLLDGATDGVASNYAAEWAIGNGIWRYDLDWKNPVRLFTTPITTIGVTYDRSAGTLWISQDGGNIQQVTLAGVVLSQFSPGTAGRWGALAWEPATDTLWAKNNYATVLRQWAKNGILLQEVSVPGLSDNIWGGEFSIFIPEPAALVCATIGLIGLMLSAPRRRNQ